MADRGPVGGSRNGQGRVNEAPVDALRRNVTRRRFIKGAWGSAPAVTVARSQPSLEIASILDHEVVVLE